MASRTPPSIEHFQGFLPIDANFLYCPNQFFDVVIPNASRGAVRLVAYMLRHTLGFIDKETGKPITEEVSFTYKELISKAGISRGAISSTIRECLDNHYIEEHADGLFYTLKWDFDESYKKKPDTFVGFFAREGNRTSIPNQFFDSVVPNEKLGVIKIVGAVIRHTIGYETQFGRRESAPLSFSFLQDYANLSRDSVWKGLRESLAKNYIECSQTGSFVSNNASTYSVKWLIDEDKEESSKNGLPGTKNGPPQGSEFKKQTAVGSKSRTSVGSKNGLNINNKQKDTSKQQGVAEFEKSVALLRKQGFSESDAAMLSKQKCFEEVQKQVEWLPDRNPQENKLGLLRRSIENSWGPPPKIEMKNKQAKLRARQDLQYASEKQREQQQDKSRREKNQRRKDSWEEMSQQEREAFLRWAIEKSCTFTANKLKNADSTRLDPLAYCLFDEWHERAVT